MIEVLPSERIGVHENRCRLFEGDPVLLQIGEGLTGVPGKHICVYTLIRQPSQCATEQTGFDLEGR